MVFIDRQLNACTILSPGTCKDNLCISVVVPERFEENEGADTVYLKILEGISHAVNMVYLPGQVKDIVLFFYKVIHGELISDIRDVDPNLVLNLFDIKKVTALPGEHVVNNCYMSTVLDKFYGEVTSDKPKTACYEDFFAGEVVHLLRFLPFS